MRKLFLINSFSNDEKMLLFEDLDLFSENISKKNLSFSNIALSLTLSAPRTAGSKDGVARGGAPFRGRACRK